MRDNNHYVVAAEMQALKLYADHPQEDIKEIELGLFSHQKAQSLYHAITVLKDSKEAITEFSLLREANQIDESVDLAQVKQVLDSGAELSAKPLILKALADSNVKNALLKITEDIKMEAISHDEINSLKVSNMIYKAQEALVHAGQRVSSKTLEKCFDEYIGVLQTRKLGKYNLCGDEFLDSALRRKAAPGQFILVAGSTGTGKSTYGLYLINGMINLGIPCIYISLEMDTESTMDRLLAMRTGIPLEEWYVAGSKVDALIERVEQERTELKDKPFRMVDEGSLSLHQIQGVIRDFKLTYKTDYVCVFIDLITQVKEFVDMGATKGNLATTIELAINKLNSLVKTERICCFGLAQMNRGADSEKITTLDAIEKLRPSLNNVKNSGALGERSRVVISVFRPKYYAERLFPENEEVDGMEDELQVQVLKQSQGRVGVIGKYLFIGESFSILPKVQDDSTEILNY